MKFELIESDKLGGGWTQSFAVVRDREVYLRIVGNGTVYRVMTATADEDIGDYRVCQNTERLWDAASQLSRTYDCFPEDSKDGKGRTYIRLFKVRQDKGVSDERFTDELFDLIDDFFVLFDELDAKSN